MEITKLTKHIDSDFWNQLLLHDYLNEIWRIDEQFHDLIRQNDLHSVP